LGGMLCLLCNGDLVHLLSDVHFALSEMKENLRDRRVEISSVGGFWNGEELRQSIRASTTGVVGSQLILALAEMGLLLPMRLLLEKGSNIDVQNYVGATALITAVYHKQFAIVHLLLEKGANTKLSTTGGSTALNYVKDDCPPELKQLLER
jgi:hypothetical protein